MVAADPEGDVDRGGIDGLVAHGVADGKEVRAGFIEGESEAVAAAVRGVAAVRHADGGKMGLHHAADRFAAERLAGLLPREEVFVLVRLFGRRPVPVNAVLHLFRQDRLPLRAVLCLCDMDLHAGKGNITIAEAEGLAYTQASRIHKGDDALVFIEAHGVDDLFHFCFCRNSREIFVISQERQLITVSFAVQDILEEKDQLCDVGVDRSVIKVTDVFQLKDVGTDLFPGNVFRELSAKRRLNEVKILVQVRSVVADRAVCEIPQSKHVGKFGNVIVSVKHNNPPKCLKTGLM